MSELANWLRASYNATSKRNPDVEAEVKKLDNQMLTGWVDLCALTDDQWGEVGLCVGVRNRLIHHLKSKGMKTDVDNRASGPSEVGSRGITKLFEMNDDDDDGGVFQPKERVKELRIRYNKKIRSAHGKTAALKLWEEKFNCDPRALKYSDSICLKPSTQKEAICIWTLDTVRPEKLSGYFAGGKEGGKAGERGAAGDFSFEDLKEMLIAISKAHPFQDGDNTIWIETVEKYSEKFDAAFDMFSAAKDDGKDE
eukprot:CAMPEP_0177674852 /NCGR_PEP_ID=MMETSP0447-20121125/26829_1 /TAXON_ID=0 /ORGANISM="Stygamoeba regulata, Strain BSH-02190019" /LENGTH=252 /DNA_ID=CAMNT_0019183081 /DNA_START=119 /DNA_END=877 /DNA_ORIENTATION=-